MFPHQFYYVSSGLSCIATACILTVFQYIFLQLVPKLRPEELGYDPTEFEVKLTALLQVTYRLSGSACMTCMAWPVCIRMLALRPRTAPCSPLQITGRRCLDRASYCHGTPRQSYLSTFGSTVLLKSHSQF